MGAAVEPEGAVLAVWLPCLVFAHVWAALFLWQLIRVARPELARRWCAPFLRVLRLTKLPDSCDGTTRAGGNVEEPATTMMMISRDPVHPVTLSWDSISCCYATHAGAKHVLQDVSGSVAAGELAAVMGPSGAGKSTLMDILTGRKSMGQLSGTIYLNNRPRCQADNHWLAYVPQDTLFVPSMTVMETCTYYAALTMPASSSSADRQQRCQVVLSEMGLLHNTATLVGGVLPGGLLLRGLSGGERKRLAIATGLLAGPSLIFLDEPTSGLDSYAAWSVMKLMRQLAHSAGHTVVACLHQPRAAIWALCDQVVLLSKGRLLYSGPCPGLVPWFEGLGYAYDPDVHGLPCDWVMDLVNIDFRSTAGSAPAETQLLQSSSSSRDLCQLVTMTGIKELEQAAHQFKLQYTNQQPQPDQLMVSKDAEAVPGSDKGAQGSSGAPLHVLVPSTATSTFSDVRPSAHPAGGAAAAQVAAPGQKDPRVAAARSTSSYSTSMADMPAPQPRSGWWRQLRALMWRELLAMSRNPADVAGRMIVFAYVGFAWGCLCYNLGVGLDAARMKVSLLYLTLQMQLLLPYMYISLYTADKRHYIEDTNAGLLSSSAYYVAKQLVVIPVQLLNVVVACTIIYSMAGLRWTAAAYFTNMAVSCLMYLIGSQVLAAAVTLTPNQDLAFMVAVSWTTLNIILNNMFVRYRDATWQWIVALRWVVATGYAMDVMVNAEFSGAVYPCSQHSLDGQLVQLLQWMFPNTPMLRSDTIRTVFASSLGSCVLYAGAMAKFYKGFSSVGLCAGLLLVYLAVLHGISYWGLCRAAKREAR